MTAPPRSLKDEIVKAIDDSVSYTDLVNRLHALLAVEGHAKGRVVLQCNQCGLVQSEWQLPLVASTSCPRHYLDDDSCDGVIVELPPITTARGLEILRRQRDKCVMGWPVETLQLIELLERLAVEGRDEDEPLNLRLHRYDDDSFVIYGRSADYGFTGHGQSPQEAMMHWVMHRNSDMRPMWPVDRHDLCAVEGRDENGRLLHIAGLVNGYHNDDHALSAAETLAEIANVLGPPMVEGRDEKKEENDLSRSDQPQLRGSDRWQS